MRGISLDAGGILFVDLLEQFGVFEVRSNDGYYITRSVGKLLPSRTKSTFFSALSDCDNFKEVLPELSHDTQSRYFDRDIGLSCITRKRPYYSVFFLDSESHRPGAPLLTQENRGTYKYYDILDTRLPPQHVKYRIPSNRTSFTKNPVTDDVFHEQRRVSQTTQRNLLSESPNVEENGDDRIIMIKSDGTSSGGSSTIQISKDPPTFDADTATPIGTNSSETNATTNKAESKDGNVVLLKQGKDYLSADDFGDDKLEEDESSPSLHDVHLPDVGFGLLPSPSSAVALQWAGIARRALDKGNSAYENLLTAVSNVKKWSQVSKSYSDMSQRAEVNSARRGEMLNDVVNKLGYRSGGDNIGVPTMRFIGDVRCLFL